MNNKTLFIFIDESGNFDFTSTGTKYFLLTSISSLTPLDNREIFSKYRYELLSQGINQECFHATEDKQDIRDQVFSFLKHCKDFSVDAVIAQKNKANPSLYKETILKNGKRITIKVEDEFYRIICQTLLKYVMRRYNNSIDNIVIVLDNLFTDKKRHLILKSLKTYLKKYCNIPFLIYFHSSKSDINCQIADYCGWAVYIKHERNELRPIRLIESKLRSEFPIFQTGVTEYYEYIKK